MWASTGRQTEHIGLQHFWGKTQHAASPWVSTRLVSATEHPEKNTHGVWQHQPETWCLLHRRRLLLVLHRRCEQRGFEMLPRGVGSQGTAWARGRQTQFQHLPVALSDQMLTRIIYENSAWLPLPCASSCEQVWMTAVWQTDSRSRSLVIFGVKWIKFSAPWSNHPALLQQSSMSTCLAHHSGF